MNTVQIKIKQIGALGALLLLPSCGDMKNVVEAPKLTVHPDFKPVDNKKNGEDPLFAKQWSLKKIEAEKAWASVGSGTRRMRVGILSSGVDYNHEDLQANLFVNQKEFTGVTQVQAKQTNGKDNDGNGYKSDLLGWDTIDNDGFPFDYLGDGTAAAGIIGAVHNNGVGIKGILSDVTMIPVRYIDSSGSGSIERLIAGLRYLNALEPKPDLVLIQVANVNFTESKAFEASGFMDGQSPLSQRDSLNSELAKFEKADIPVVVSAGNRRSDVEKVKGVIAELSKKKNVFIVTSTDENDNKPGAANFSPQYVVTAAPGVNILTTAPGNKYEYKKGTFLAAAHVAGALTLALGKYHGRISIDDLRTTLLKGEASDQVAGLTDYTLGSNRLNMGKFIDSLVATKKQ